MRARWKVRHRSSRVGRSHRRKDASPQAVSARIRGRDHLGMASDFISESRGFEIGMVSENVGIQFLSLRQRVSSKILCRLSSAQKFQINTGLRTQNSGLRRSSGAQNSLASAVFLQTSRLRFGGTLCLRDLYASDPWRATSSVHSNLARGGASLDAGKDG